MSTAPFKRPPAGAQRQVPADLFAGRGWDQLSLAEQFALQPETEQEAFYAGLSDAEWLELMWDWRFWARPSQLPPAGGWAIWNIRAGRGFGKTRSGTGWVQERAQEQPRWIALIAKTPADARDFMIEGPGGFLDQKGWNVRPDQRPRYSPSNRRLTWPNGSWATIFSAEDPEQLRGFSGDTAWLDEFGKYPNPEEVWDALAFGMRETSSDRPRRLITSTPRPIPIIGRIEALPGTITVRGSSYENRANLDPNWFKELQEYEGTQLGRQEIHGDLLDPEESGIIKRSWFRLWPHDKALPAFEFVIASFDTAFTEDTYDRKTHEADPTACDVFGLCTIAKKPVILHLDSWEELLGFPELIERLKKEARTAWGEVHAPLIRPLIGPPLGTGEGRKPDLLVVEDKGSGISARQALARENIIVHAYNPGKLSKLTRLHLVSHVLKQGYVWLVESDDSRRRGKPRTWAESAVSQLCSFQGDGSIPHDDHVDTWTQALRVFLDQHLISVGEPVLEEDRVNAEEASRFGRPRLRNVYAV